MTRRPAPRWRKLARGLLADAEPERAVALALERHSHREDVETLIGVARERLDRTPVGLRGSQAAAWIRGRDSMWKALRKAASE